MTEQKRTEPAPALPKGAGPAGRKVWRALTAEFELEPWELAVLVQCVRTVDVCELLESVVAAEGPLLTGKDGVLRAHPGLVELRQERLALGRLLASLQIPADEEGRLQRRSGFRGPYGVRGVVA